MPSAAYLENVKRQFRVIDAMTAEQRQLVHKYGLKRALQKIRIPDERVSPDRA